MGVGWGGRGRDKGGKRKSKHLPTATFITVFQALVDVCGDMLYQHKISFHVQEGLRQLVACLFCQQLCGQ